jgi:hypothetical protein
MKVGLTGMESCLTGRVTAMNAADRWIPTGLENLLTRSRASVSVRRTLSGRPEDAVVRRERLFALSGAVLGFGLCYGVLAVASVFRTQPPGEVPKAEPPNSAPAVAEADSSVDPAMLANANLSRSLSECSHQLGLVTEENVQLEQQLDTERNAAADAGKSALARRIARRDLSTDDWKQLARTGAIKYVLPCASFNPSPETLDGLGLEPNDVPVVREAFVAARAVAWGQVRPLCASAVGSLNAADRLGLEACPQLILSSERTTSPNAADVATRAVAATRAGLSDPSALPAGDAVATTFFALTAVAKDAENHIAAQLGPDEAQVAVYGTNSCSHMVDFPGPGPEAD